MDYQYQQQRESFLETHPKSTLPVNGIPISYFLTGRGRKIIVLLPGDNAAAIPFFPIATALEKRFRVLAVDYPAGFPDTPSLAQALVRLFQVLDLPKAFLYGTGYGGLLAQYLAKHYPEWVAGLVLCSPAPQEGQDYGGHIRRYKKELGRAKMMTAQSIRQALTKRMQEASNVEMAPFLYDRLDKNVYIVHCMRQVDFWENHRFAQEDFKYLSSRVLLLGANDAERETAAGLFTFPIVDEVAGGEFSVYIDPDRTATLLWGYLNAMPGDIVHKARG